MANEILKFGETATNILTQAEYDADAQRLIGNQPGIARSKLVNKVLRQCAFISNAFADYLVSRVGGDVLDNGDSATLLAKITAAFTYTFTNANYIINGNMDYWQRGTSVSVTATNTYTADRFVGVMAGSTATIARQVTALTESFNAKYFLRSSVTSVANIANFNLLGQRIENVTRLGSKQVTLSFWAKADSARNMSVEFVQNFGTGGSPSAEVNSQGIQKYALTTSWQKFTKTFTLASISGKVLGTNGNDYTQLNFWFDAGSNYNARTDSLGQQSGTFDIAQIKIEDGANATEFILAGTTLAGELLACQRFYESKATTSDFTPSGSGSRWQTQWSALKRAVPTLTKINLHASGAGAYSVQQNNLDGCYGGAGGISVGDYVAFNHIGDAEL